MSPRMWTDSPDITPEEIEATARGDRELLSAEEKTAVFEAQAEIINTIITKVNGLEDEEPKLQVLFNVMLFCAADMVNGFEVPEEGIFRKLKNAVLYEKERANNG